MGYEYKKIDNKPLINGFKKNELFEKKDNLCKMKYLVKQCGEQQIYSNELVPTVAYSMYSLGDVCIPYESKTIGWLNAGGTHTMIFQQEVSTTYQEKVNLTMNSSFGFSLQEKFPVEVLSLNVKATSSISSSIGFESGFSTTYSCLEGHQYTEPILESGYYLQQKRAIFEAFFLEEYGINYNESTSTSWHWLCFHNDIIYSKKTDYPKSYTLKNIKLLLKFKTDLGSLLALYSLDEDNRLCYAGPKANENTTLYV